MKDIIIPGRGAFGGVAERLLDVNMDPGALRPWKDDDGRSYITVNQENHLATNATLRYDEWKLIDRKVVEVAKERLVCVNDLVSRGLVYDIGNGMASTVLGYQDEGDITGAEISMDGLTRGRSDRPLFDTKWLPLPIFHKDFHINSRHLQESRTFGRGLDLRMAAASARKVAEAVEALLVTGTGALSYGGGQIYGYTTHPNRSTVTLATHWDDAGATGSTVVDDVLAMKQASIDAKHYGPWALYVPTCYETVLDDDHKAESDRTIRERVLAIEGIQSVRIADMLPAHNVILVELQEETVRMVSGLEPTTVQWEQEGGMLLLFKVMTIMVPQIRADQSGNSGLVHLS